MIQRPLQSSEPKTKEKAKGMLRENTVVGDTKRGGYSDCESDESKTKKTKEKLEEPPLFQLKKADRGGNNNDSPARNTRKRTAAESPQKEKRSKRK